MRICSTILGVALSSMAWSASALSLGSPRGNVVLGAPFDVVVGVQPDSGTELAASCVTAQLHAGDRPIESSRVRVTPLASGNAVRVQSTYMVDEPVLTLKLLAGCQGAMSRSYTLLSQLPDSANSAAAGRDGNQPINVAQLAGSAAAQRLPDAEPAAARGAPAAPAAAAGNAPAPRATSTGPAPAPRKAAAPAAAPNKARKAAIDPSTLAGLPQLRMGPQLRMEPLGDWLGADAAAPAAADAPPPVPDAAAEQLAQANQRVLALETELGTLKKRGGADSAQIAQLRSELETLRQESGDSSWLFNALLLALIAAVAIIGWLAWRLRSGADTLFQRDQEDWRKSVERSSEPGEAAAFGFSAERDDIDTVLTAPAEQPAASQARTQADERRGPDTTVSPYLQRGIQMQPGVTYEFQEDLDPGDLGPATIPVGLQAAMSSAQAPAVAAAVGTAVADGAQRGDAGKLRRMVQPEQLFDVQQQAEFFISVGEHQQAIALLRSHIDAHEDSSPLAYLELLHLYYTLSRREEYEHLRERFAQHFNGRVPAMMGFVDKGRSLLQGYTEELARIEALWPSEEVHACLARYLFKQDGVAALDAPPAFDLAAFEELLMLLAVAGGTGEGARGAMQGRVRTTPLPGASAGAPEQGPATAVLDVHIPLVADTLRFPDSRLPVPASARPAAAASGVPQAFLAPSAAAAGDQGLEFSTPETLRLDLPPPAPVPSASPQSRSAPLQFDLQQLDFDIAQAELPDPGQMRSQPLEREQPYRSDPSLPMLDIDLSVLTEEDRPGAVPARPLPDALAGTDERSLKIPLDTNLAIESWQLEPPDTLSGPVGLDEPLSRSVDMLLSRETDPVFRRAPVSDELHLMPDGEDPKKTKP